VVLVLVLLVLVLVPVAEVAAVVLMVQMVQLVLLVLGEVVLVGADVARLLIVDLEGRRSRPTAAARRRQLLRQRQRRRMKWVECPRTSCGARPSGKHRPMRRLRARLRSQSARRA